MAAMKLQHSLLSSCRENSFPRRGPWGIDHPCMYGAEEQIEGTKSTA
ncbi:hypothetical protein SAMN02910435_00692 [Ruminococcaceae bacterium D5]|nr:hypothetical protein [Faecalicatena sp. BF-R-105]SFI74748.1 hypothetical protein SAMN02910435_00692 [Ruminococcaceae bacterium D5]